MATKVLLAQRNSSYKVFQNAIKGNSYSDVVAFKTLAERDEFMNGFLGQDWKKEFDKVESKHIVKTDDIHFTVSLDLTKDTMFGLSRQKAQQCDLIILEDDNEKEDSPYRYTFWSAQTQLDPNQVYTTLEFKCEMDMFMTIPFNDMFKDDVKIRLDRGESNQEIGYNSELSYGEDFQFNIDNYVPAFKDKTKNDRFVFNKAKDSSNFEDVAVIVSINSSQAYATGELLNYQYSFPIYYSMSSSTTVTQHTLKLDKLKNPISASTGLIVPDITYLIFRNKLSIPSEIRRSEYLISIQQLPLPYSIISPYNPDEVITLDGKQIECKDVSIDSELKKSLQFNLPLSQVKSDGKIYSSSINDMIKATGNTDDEKYDLHNKMAHSSFNKSVLSYGQLRMEIKAEDWTFAQTSNSLNGKLVFTPQAIDMYCDLGNEPFYSINFIWNYRAINIAADFKLPSIVSGDQGTLQNFNSINVTSKINDRDMKFQEAQGAFTIASGTLDVAKGVGAAVLTGGIFGYGNMIKGASEITQGIQMEMSAHDNINKQAANLADAHNNLGQFNDGTKDGIEAYDSDGIEVYKYTLQEPLRTMVVDYFNMYGYNQGGALYDIRKKAHARSKHDYIRASDDIGIVYQALREDISPSQARIIALSLLQGIRLWWSDKFTYVGDYESDNLALDENGKEIPNTQIK